MIVDTAEISGARFNDLTWRNVKFIHCDFVGGYEIDLRALENCTFEDCRFAGIINWGTASNVLFLRCQVAPGSYVLDSSKSRDVRFDGCQFVGTDPDPNHWGAMGSRGDATFVGCTATKFALVGYKKIALLDCEMTDVELGTDSPAISGAGFASSEVLIERCKLRGTFDVKAANLQSLTIRDTVIETVDLRKSTVKGAITIDRVRGGYINAYVKKADSLVMRNSYMYGNGRDVFEAYAGGIRIVEIDDVVFGGGISTEPITIAGGTGADLANVRARVNERIAIQRCRIPRLSTHHVHTSDYQLLNCEIDSLDLSSSRIAKLELTGNTFTRSVDLTNTLAQQTRVQSLPSDRVKLDGSNVKVSD